MIELFFFLNYLGLINCFNFFLSASESELSSIYLSIYLSIYIL